MQQDVETDLERYLCDGDRWNSKSTLMSSPRTDGFSSLSEFGNEKDERNRRSRNPGTAPSAKQSVCHLKKVRHFCTVLRKV